MYCISIVEHGRNQPKKVLEPSTQELLDTLVGEVKIKLSDTQALLYSKSEDGKEQYSISDLKVETPIVEEPVAYYAINDETMQCFFEKGKYTLKIPIMKVGKWVHEVYGEINNTEKTLSEITSNFRERKAGFEAPLYLGHPKDEHSVGGAPSEGYLTEIIQEGDTLFGYWDVNETIYGMVKDGKYRYSSAELARHYKDRKTGKGVGTVLLGMALTNTPFMDLPELQALSSPLVDLVLTYNYTNTHNKEEIKMEQPLNQEFKETTDKLEQKLEQYAIQLTAVEAAYKEQLAQAFEQNKALQTRLELTEQKLKEQHVNSKLEYLSSLELPGSIKEKYTVLIKDGSLGQAEDSVLESLKELSATFGKNVFSQVGNATVTEEVPEVKNPFEETIARNAAQVLARSK